MAMQVAPHPLMATCGPLTHRLQQLVLDLAVTTLLL
jgi:hypothetical protein